MIKALEKQENESNRGQHDDIGRHVDRGAMRVIPPRSGDEIWVGLPQTAKEIAVGHVLIQCTLQIQNKLNNT